MLGLAREKETNHMSCCSNITAPTTLYPDCASLTGMRWQSQWFRHMVVTEDMCSVMSDSLRFHGL